MKIVSLVGQPPRGQRKSCQTTQDRLGRHGACGGADGETIKQKILQADGLVLASPNYIFSVSAQLKAFVDRCFGRNIVA